MTTHPLDPLNEAEIIRAAAIVRSHGGLSATAWFETIALHEPLKSALKAGDWRRQAFVCCYDPTSGETWDGIADLADGTLANWHHAPGMQARIVTDEFIRGGEIAKQDPAFIEACAKRGITDLSDVLVEPWAAGHFGVADERRPSASPMATAGSGTAPATIHMRGPSAYLHPVVDLRRMKVLRVDDLGVVPLPPESTPFIHLAAHRSETARDHPAGRAELHGRGQSRSLAEMALPRRLPCARRTHPSHHRLRGSGRVRPIMHRASMAEMVVPYGDPTGSYSAAMPSIPANMASASFSIRLRSAATALGTSIISTPGATTGMASPSKIANAICMHEEDFGILWKFSDTMRSDVTVRRSRRLVVSCLATIGNYVYGFFWYFYQDGTIGVEVKATGIPLGIGRAVDEPSDLRRIGGARNRSACASACLLVPLRHVRGWGARTQSPR